VFEKDLAAATSLLAMLWLSKILSLIIELVNICLNMKNYYRSEAALEAGVL